MEAMRGASSLISISADSLYTSAMKAVHWRSNLPFRNMSFVTLKSIVDLDTWESSSCGMAKYLVLYTKLSFAICKNSERIHYSLCKRFNKSPILQVRLNSRMIKLRRQGMLEKFYSPGKTFLFFIFLPRNEEDLIRKLLSFTRRGVFNNARK